MTAITRVLVFLAGALGFDLLFSSGAWAWGAAVHTVVACNILEQTASILPAIGEIIRAYPLEYVYGNLAADFFVGKGMKNKKGHSHNWETGLRFLEEASDERETSYAYGFLSHLAADVVAHNYFVPNLICSAFSWKKMGHIYWEARADYEMGHLYTRIAKEVLSMSHLGCDKMLISAVGKRVNGLKTRRRIYTQSVKLSDYLYMVPPSPFEKSARSIIFNRYLGFTVGLSYRLVQDFLARPDSSPCLSYDPIGAHNLLVASKYQSGNRWRQLESMEKSIFPVDQELMRV